MSMPEAKPAIPVCPVTPGRLFCDPENPGCGEWWKPVPSNHPQALSEGTIYGCNHPDAQDAQGICPAGLRPTGFETAE